MFLIDDIKPIIEKKFNTCYFLCDRVMFDSGNKNIIYKKREYHLHIKI